MRKVLLVASFLTLSSPLLASNVCELTGRYTTSRSCRYGEVYVGPNRPDVHGGTCLKYNEEVCGFTSRYVLRKESCNYQGNEVYVGPNRPDLHGGFCLKETTGKELRTYYTDESKDCDYGDIYAGPNRPDVHGGYCIEVRERS